jgi:hypothetical protein
MIVEGAKPQTRNDDQLIRATNVYVQTLGEIVWRRSLLIIMILPGDRSDREMVQDQCGHRLSDKLTPATELFLLLVISTQSEVSSYQ